MARDMIKTASRADVDRYYDLEAVDLVHLKMTTDDPYLALVTAFKYGYVMGGRACKAGKYRERGDEQGKA